MKSISDSPASGSLTLLISDRVYRLLLAAYPAEFRRRYGPEMVQVFRTSCRISYRASGAGGVARLWLPTLWDWACSVAGERFSSIFRMSKVYHIHAGRASSQLIPMLFFLNACLILLFINPCSWLSGSPFSVVETCGFVINNQSGKTLRVTPIYIDHNSFSPVRLYRNTLPDFPAYQQRNISVKSGERVTWSYDCSSTGVSDVTELYVCDLEGECYVHMHLQLISTYVSENGITRLFGGFSIYSLESLSRPDAALEAAIQSFPEHNYSGMKNVLLCFTFIIALIGGFYWLVRTKTYEIPKHDI